MDSPAQQVALWLLLCALAGSTATCYYLVQRRLAGQTPLPRQPRRPVPWSGWLVAAVLGFPAFSLVTARLAPPTLPALEETIATAAEIVSTGVGPLDGVRSALVKAAIEAAEQAAASEKFIRLAWSNAAASILMTAMIYLLLIVVYHAQRTDLGWPGQWSEAGRDAWIGLVGWLAALAPVMLLNIALHLFFQPETQHPFIDQAMNNPSLTMLLAVAVSAIVVAPLFEETVFRLLLQGWLESAERRQLSPSDDPGMPPRHAAAGWFGLPVGWTPMICSATLFGFAHWGHGLDPVPLIVLGLILGYIYQQTHHILPCMILHALFNAFTVFYLALITQAG